MGRFSDFLKWVKGDEEYEEEQEPVRQREEEPVVNNSGSMGSGIGSGGGGYSGYDTPAAEPPVSRRGGGKVLNLNNAAQLSVVLVKPERFEAAADIADHLKEQRAVLLNLEQADGEVSRRMVDFLSGVAYAKEGKVKKVAKSTYIITPCNVEVVGDLIDELENNGVYF